MKNREITGPLEYKVSQKVTHFWSVEDAQVVKSKHLKPGGSQFIFPCLCVCARHALNSKTRGVNPACITRL